MDKTELIITDKICRYFQNGKETVKALNMVSVAIKKGTLTIFKGRSGSGKTTLMNILGSMDMPTSGKLFFHDTEITTLTEQKRDELRRKSMGFVFQSGALLGNLSAYENVEFCLRVAGYANKDIKKRAEECLSLVGLSKRMNHRPQELSGGEQQRVAIARAVAHKPEIVFADEPTSALDSTMSLQVVKTFKDMVRQEGITIVMTTHDPSMMEIADQVFTLKDGEIVIE